MKIAILLPVSRDSFLEEVFKSVNDLICDINEVSLFVYVDGDVKLFETAREFVRESKFTEKLCVFRKKGLPNISHMTSRRKRIGDIHIEMGTYINDVDYVFLIEDDTLFPSNSLVRLLDVFNKNYNVGIVSGMEMGRWGVNYIGIWEVDNINNVRHIQSVSDIGKEIEKIDSCGFYCCLTSYNNYITGVFSPFYGILGPDFNYGLNLRIKGLDNYVDRSIKCVHKTQTHDLIINDYDTEIVKFDRIDNSSNWDLTY